jgi:hypothetical protein
MNRTDVVRPMSLCVCVATRRVTKVVVCSDFMLQIPQKNSKLREVPAYFKPN